MTTRPMRDCPRYDSCSVPLCPLDAGWRKRAVVPGEAVCPYLRELGKPGDPRERFAGRYDSFVIDAAIVMHAALRDDPHPRYVAVVRAIEASAGTPSLIEQAAATAARFAAARRSKGRSAAPCSDSVEGEPSPAGTPGGVT